MLNIWLVNTGEEVAFSSATRRLRMGLLAKALADAGHVVTWWTGDFDHTTKQHVRHAEGRTAVDDGFEVQPLHGPGYRSNVSLARILHHVWLAVTFYRRARRVDRPDVIVVTLPTIEFCVAVGLFCRKEIPYIVDIRDLYPDTYEIAIPARFRWLARKALRPWRGLAAWALRNATMITGVSDSYLRWGLDLAGRERRPTEIVLPISRSASTNDDPPRSSSGRIVAIFVGTFGKTYDLDAIVEAARVMAHDLDIVLVGDGERMAQVRAAASGLKNVHFAGWCDADSMTTHLAAADIGLATFVPGAPQSLPNKLVEYLAAGLPVVNSLTGDAAALIDEEGCGVNYRAGSVDDLCKAITTLLSPAARHECSVAARRVFAARFDSGLVNARFVSMIERAAGTASPER